MAARKFGDEFIQKVHDDRIFQDGRNAERDELAQKMIEEGLPDGMIARITGLSVDKVNDLKAGMSSSGSNA